MSLRESHQLPQELFEEILNYLSHDVNTLKSCSITCRSLLPLCQKHLFSKVVLQPPDYEEEENCLTGIIFTQILDVSPHIANYVECLQISDVERSSTRYRQDYAEWMSRDIGLSATLLRLCNLKALILQYRDFYDPAANWERLCAEGIFSSLLDAMSSPALIYLDLINFPLRMLDYCPHVKHVVLRNPIFENHGPAATVMANRTSTRIFLESLRLNSSDRLQTINWLLSEENRVSVTRLKRLYYPSERLLGVETDSADRRQLARILEACAGTLEELILEPDSGFRYPPDLSTADEQVPANFPVLKSLRRICIRSEVIHLTWGAKDYLPWTIRLLKSLTSHPLYVEELVLYIDFDWNDVGPELSNHTELAAILEDVSRFPSFRRLSIRVSSPSTEVGKRNVDIVEQLRACLKDFGRNSKRQIQIEANSVWESFAVFDCHEAWKAVKL